jgi:TatD DNase family protein
MELPGSAQPIPLLDAHNHLQDERLTPYREEILNLYKELAVEAVVVNGTRPEDWPTVAALPQTGSTMVLRSFGLHPWYVQGVAEDWKKQLEQHLEGRSAFLGEIGLDRWVQGVDWQKQLRVFQWQLSLAIERRLPLTLHCLQAWGAIYDILRTQQPTAPFLLHSYSGPAEMIPQFVQLGAYFSVSGYFAHPRKAKQREVLRTIPLNRLLLETDAPDMLPPEEGRDFTLPEASGRELNHPGNIAGVYRFAAELFSLELQPLAEQIRTNFRTFFRVP